MAEVVALIMAALLATALAHYIKNWLRPFATRADLPHLAAPPRRRGHGGRARVARAGC